MSQEESLQIIITQLQILAVYLARPQVQRQVLALAAILAFSWALPALLRAWGRRITRSSHTHGHAPTGVIGFCQRWLGPYYLIYAPLLALLLIQIAEWGFARLGTPFGMLSQANLYSL